MYRQPAAKPKNRLPLLDRLAIKTPCKASWNDMEGDDRVRFCCACSKNVHDISAMTEDEAEAFLAFHLDDQDACVKLYRRPDGRILTSDCPRGASTRHARRAAIAGAAAVCAVAAVAAVVGDAHVPRAHHLPRSTSRFEVPRPAPGAPRTMSTMGRDDVAVSINEPWGVEEPPPSHPVRKVDSPRIRIGEGAKASGGIPIEVILRITRQNFGRFRLAYERGLKGNPSLAGRVVVRFTIGPDGSVLQAADQGSSLPDAAVIHDVVRSFMNLSFPTPEHGSVIVTFPLDLAP